MQLRYETHDYAMDKYFEKLKTYVDEKSQNLTAVIYLKNGILSEARKYFLRSLYFLVSLFSVFLNKGPQIFILHGVPQILQPSLPGNVEYPSQTGEEGAISQDTVRLIEK